MILRSDILGSHEDLVNLVPSRTDRVTVRSALGLAALA